MNWWKRNQPDWEVLGFILCSLGVAALLGMMLFMGTRIPF